MKNGFVYETEFGNIVICDNGNSITNISLNHKINWSNIRYYETELIKEAFIQIEEFISGKRREFIIPIELEGTDFQKKVWRELIKIPYGSTKSYKDIATSIENEKGFRAVGNANGKNPILFIVPCHRVINSDGSLGGFSAGLEVKKKLLDMEKELSEKK